MVKTEELDKTDNSMIFIERDNALGREEIYKKIQTLRDDIKGKRAKKDTESQFTTDKANNIEETASNSTDNERSVEEIKRKNRIPFYPKEWKDSFGLPVEEHRKALEINMLDGYDKCLDDVKERVYTRDIFYRD